MTQPISSQIHGHYSGLHYDGLLAPRTDGEP